MAASPLGGKDNAGRTALGDFAHASALHKYDPTGNVQTILPFMGSGYRVHAPYSSGAHPWPKGQWRRAKMCNHLAARTD
jgi:hypothetical protein